MTLLVAIKQQYEQNKELPTDKQLDELYQKADTPEENPEKEEDETDISSLSVEELKKAKSNAKSKITKAKTCCCTLRRASLKTARKIRFRTAPNA